MAFSKSFCRQFPTKAKYEGNLWDCSIMLNYYLNYVKSSTELLPEEGILVRHTFYLVKAAILILFYSLLRPAEMYRIKTRDGDLLEEKEGFTLRVKTKSSFNQDTFVFIPKIKDKRICAWEAICNLREYNKEIFKKNVNKSSSMSFLENP
jgi:hypothetical protein